MTGLPRWAGWLVTRLAPRGEADAVLGDLQEAHGRRAARYRFTATLRTALEVVEMCVALVYVRTARRRFTGVDMLQDFRLAVRMLAKYPGLTVAGGLAIAIAIGAGAAWYDVTRDVLRPAIPLPGGERLVSIEMRSRLGGEEERLLHDLLAWQRDARTLVDLGAYRTVERNLTMGDAPPEPVTIAETTAAAFVATRVPPQFGRPLVEADERPGAPSVVVLGYDLWKQRFGGRADAVGRTVLLGDTPTTVVGVMPAGFAFPVNHRLWVPLRLQATYAPLDGPAVTVFGRVAPDTTQAQANAELAAMAERMASDQAATHQHLRPRVLAYGGESPGDTSWLELAVTHLPILLVLTVACTTVGTLIYARTATREAEIATRCALGAGRARIVAQLFVEALALSVAAAAVGLVVAHRAVQWGMGLYFAGQAGGLPFWVQPGLKPATVLYAAGLAVLGAALLGVLPALKATSARALSQVRTLGAGTSTLRFGPVWTAAMIAQVALTVICLPPAFGISQEAVRDRRIRSQFPAHEYLAVRLDFDGNAEAKYAELQRQLRRQPEVRAVTYGDRLPGMSPDAATAEVEVTAGEAPTLIPSLWLTSIGPGFLDTFAVPVVAGRDFTEADRLGTPRSVLVNEAFARQFLQGGSPVGRRVRLASRDAGAEQPWLEIVGMVRDVGMTPTDRGEAPYMFTPASIATIASPVVALRASGDPTALAPRVRAIAATLDLGVRLDEVRVLDAIVWSVDVPMMAAAGAIVAVVSLGLFLSAAGIFALMSVTVARRTREIGIRTALGASRERLLLGVFARAAALVGGGIAAGNGFLLLVIALSDGADVADVAGALLVTSSVMFVAGLLACVEPALRALRIHPAEALKVA